MMAKAFLLLMLVLATVDYVATGGAYCMLTLKGIGDFFSWLAGAGRNSVFAR